MRRLQIVFTALLLFVPIAASRATEPGANQPARKTRTRNILLVTTDGLRWQEVFGGAEPALLNKEDGGVQKVDLLQKEFGGDTPGSATKTLYCRLCGM